MIDVAAHTSVIVPALNEGLAVRQLVTDLQHAAPWHEILVVDDGSSDDTGAQAASNGVSPRIISRIIVLPKARAALSLASAIRPQVSRSLPSAL